MQSLIKANFDTILFWNVGSFSVYNPVKLKKQGDFEPFIVQQLHADIFEYLVYSNQVQAEQKNV